MKSDRKKCKVRARIHNFAHMNNAAITTCVAFTGHRTYNHEANRLLRHTVLSLHSAGKHTFLSGMAAGFDMAAAEAVLDCRTARTDIRLVAVIPFRGQEERFSSHDRIRYEQILAEADETVILSEYYTRGVYAVRNDYLIAHAATLITWYDGSTGGTRYTIERALAQRRKLIHLHPSTPLSVYPDPELFL